MKLLRIFLALLVLAVAIPATGAVVWEDGDQALKINYLLQTQFTMLEDEAPKGDTWGKDFFIRRSRILLGGNICKNISFFMETDQANYGKNGNWGGQFFVQDAFMTFNVAKRAFMIDAGMIILPFTRHYVQSAVSLQTVDYHTGVIKYPTSKVWRDAGIQFRGYLMGDKLQYRVGIFNGIEGAAPAGDAADAGPIVNESDMPRITGRVMYNIMGKETGFYYGGIHFAKDPIISVGLAFDMQPDAIVDADGKLAMYMAYGADVYVDYPMGVGELVAQANVMMYDRGDKALNSGMGLFGEVGYRYQQISLVAAMDMFMSDAKDGDDKPVNDLQQMQFGCNFWIKKHNANVKAAMTMTKMGNTDDADFVKGLIVQGQFFF